jgi:hypothetical protein
MFDLLRAAGLCLAVGLTCATASARDTPPLTPPVAQSSTDVPYPAGAEGEAAVVLELVVEKDGSVSSALVVEGTEPFAEHARQAALRWRFDSARRGDVPVAARIRARVEFHRQDEEPATAPPAPSTSAPVAPVAPAPVAVTPMEVTVVGERREIGQTTLSKRDVREMPGAFGDAFRAIEALPGVTPLASGLPYFYVRGAPPNNAGYYVDGVRVPLLFHLGLGQSVIHPGLIDHVDFFPSVAPARYGTFVGPIVAGQTRPPASAPHGEANVRLVDAGALLEAPFGAGRGSALVAGRYGYPGPIVAAITDDMQLGYWDYQLRASWKPSRRDSVGVFAFGSHDYLATRSPSGDPEAKKQLVEQFVSDFHRVDLRYDHALDDGRLRLALTGGYDSQGAAPTYATDKSLAARLEVEQQLTDTLRFRGGADGRLDHYRMRVTAQGPGEPVVPQSANPPPTNLSGGVNLELLWRAARRVELSAGLRFDVFASSRRRESPSTGRARNVLRAVDPRLAARITLAPGAAWLSSFGMSHQYPSLRLGNVPAPLVSVPGFPFGHPQLQSAMQGSEGFEVSLPADLVLSATGFYSSFWGLTDLSASCFQLEPATREPPPPGAPQIVVPPYVCPNNQPVRGRAYGVELMLRRPLSKKISGWLSYTLSRATREAHFLTPAGGDDVASVPSEFDRTHVLNAILGYDLGRGWRVGSRLLLYSGTPYSHLEGSVAVPPYNAYRNPLFYRVDFRLEKRWRLAETRSIAFVLEGQNVTLQKEVTSLGMDCEGERTSTGETTHCQPSKIGPLTIPSVGVEAFF